jgi:hypothetical protein
MNAGRRAEVLAVTLRALAACDRAELTRVLAPDVRVWSPELATTTRDELLAALERRDEAFGDVSVEVRPLDVGGLQACAEWTMSTRLVGPIELAGGDVLEPDDSEIFLNGVAVADFDGDTIAALRQYWNVDSLYTQLGIDR